NHPHRFGVRPNILTHQLAATLEAATSENYGIGGERLDRTVLRHDQASDVPIFRSQLLYGAAVEKRHTCLLGCTRQLFDDGRPASDRLNTRWTFREIVARLNKFD